MSLKDFSNLVIRDEVNASQPLNVASQATPLAFSTPYERSSQTHVQTHDHARSLTHEHEYPQKSADLRDFDSQNPLEWLDTCELHFDLHNVNES